MFGLNVALAMGVLVIVTGVALVGVQVMEGGGQEMEEHSFKLIGAEAGSTKFQIETSFPGVAVIALGILLMIAGAAMSRGS
ncbi:MAG: hypothetical protein HPY61_08305 [Methanotrichaceae archaeon]|nr:hypothetical protein [Methanotrichaceae archaeon]